VNVYGIFIYRNGLIELLHNLSSSLEHGHEKINKNKRKSNITEYEKFIQLNEHNELVFILGIPTS
jgi:hypothetical protein